MAMRSMNRAQQVVKQGAQSTHNVPIFAVPASESKDYVVDFVAQHQKVYLPRGTRLDYNINGHENQDGSDYNLSWNCGWEGDDGVPDEVLSLRKQQVKNLFCLLMLSNGTPMFSAGDEFMNTQKGNNNPYNQDNETTWLDWDLLKKNADVFRFFKNMIAFRKSHPSLCRSRFWRNDVKWCGARGGVDLSSESRTLAFCLQGASQSDQDLYVMINCGAEDVIFDLQTLGNRPWHYVVNTASESPDDLKDPDQQQPLTDRTCIVAAHSISVLIQQ